MTEVNLACPGETTETFVHGGCFYTELFGLPIHTVYTGSQLDVAEAFLRRHRGQVNPIIQRHPCGLLFVCDPDFLDIHPTDDGYRALGDALWQASGFAP